MALEHVEREVFIYSYLPHVGKGESSGEKKLAARHAQLNLHQCRRGSSVLPMKTRGLVALQITR